MLHDIIHGKLLLHQRVQLLLRVIGQHILQGHMITGCKILQLLFSHCQVLFLCDLIRYQQLAHLLGGSLPQLIPELLQGHGLHGEHLRKAKAIGLIQHGLIIVHDQIGDLPFHRFLRGLYLRILHHCADGEIGKILMLGKIFVFLQHGPDIFHIFLCGGAVGVDLRRQAVRKLRHPLHVVDGHVKNHLCACQVFVEIVLREGQIQADLFALFVAYKAVLKAVDEPA